jgi:hypothetical protein
MVKRLSTVLATTLLLFGSSIPSANASLSTGACVITLSFNFDGAVGVGLTAPSFSLGGLGTCAATLGGDVVASTSIGGSGSSIVWNCGLTAAEGFWSQSFSNDLPDADGNFTVAGENGAWVLVIEAPGYVGVAQMTSLDGVKIATCPVTPIQTITMSGVMEFQDP